MELLELYKAILESLHFKATPEGLLTYHYDGEEYPAVIDGKRLTLPTPEILRSGNWEGRIAFHPLSENPLRGESPVLGKIKAVMNHRASFILSELLYQFAELGVDTARHKTLIPKAAEVLSAMPGIDEKFVETLRKILGKQAADGPNRLVSIYLKRGGTYKGQKYARVAVVSFPMLEQVQGEPDNVFGVKVRKKDLVILESLFKYILPDADVIETYNAPSRSMSTPYFDALLHAFYNVVNRLNQVIHLQRKQLANEDELRTRTDWIDAIADLTRFEGQIPSLTGNEGEGAGVEEPAAAATVQAVRPTPAFNAAPAAATAVPVKAEERSQPVLGRSEPKEAKSPFHVENLRSNATGPFQAGAPAPAQAGSVFQANVKDPNAFERPADYEPPKGQQDFAKWWADRNKPAAAAPAPVAPTGFGPNPTYQPVNQFQPQPAYAVAPAYGQPPVNPANVPSWMQAGPAPVPPGEYAGRVRGVSPQPTFAYGYGQPAVSRGGYATGPQFGAGSSVYPTMNVPPGGFGGSAL